MFLTLLSQCPFPSTPTGLLPLACPYPALCNLPAPARAVAPARNTLPLPTGPTSLPACFFLSLQVLAETSLPPGSPPGFAPPNPDCGATVPVCCVSGHCSRAIIVSSLISLCHWTANSLTVKSMTVLLTLMFLISGNVAAQSQINKTLCGRQGWTGAAWACLRKVAAPTQTLGRTQGPLGTDIRVEEGGAVDWESRSWWVLVWPD